MMKFIAYAFLGIHFVKTCISRLFSRRGLDAFKRDYQLPT